MLILSHAGERAVGAGRIRGLAPGVRRLLGVPAGASAIFTAPHHANFGGAALIDRSGRLLGIGSLQVPEAIPGQPVPGNMFVPIDLLKPILSDLTREGVFGQPRGSPWLGAQMEDGGCDT